MNIIRKNRVVSYKYSFKILYFSLFLSNKDISQIQDVLTSHILTNVFKQKKIKINYSSVHPGEMIFSNADPSMKCTKKKETKKIKVK